MAASWVFDPRTFLSLCKQVFDLKNQVNDECVHRTIVNRSYLAAYQVAYAYLQGLGRQLPRDHTAYVAVEQKLVLTPVKPAYKDLLARLRIAREKADYEYDERVTESNAIDCLYFADKIVEEIDSV